MNRFLQIVLCLIFLVASTDFAKGNESAGQARVRSETLTVYSEMKTNSHIVKSIKKGAEVAVELEMEGPDGAWCGIVERGNAAITGYVQCKHLEQNRIHQKTWRTVQSGHRQSVQREPINNREESASFNGTVELFVTSWCPHCKEALKYLQGKGILYSAYDIEKDEQAKRRYRELGAGGVPLILIGKNKIQRV